MWRLGCLGAIGAVFLLWSGGQGAYTAVTNWDPTQMSCKDYLARRPSGIWLKLEGCQVSLIEGSYFERGGRIEELFLPLRPADEPEQEKSQKIQVLLSTKDPKLLNLARQLRDIKDQGQFLKFALENRDQVFAKKNVEGLMRFGVDLDDDDRKKLAGLDKELAADFLILDEGKKPSFATSLGMLGGGLVLALVLLGAAAKKSS